VNNNPHDLCDTTARNLLLANGMSASDAPALIRGTLTSAVLDIYWAAMLAHFDCDDRHAALNSILALNEAMNQAVEHAQNIKGSLNGCED
jgi:hypothetical protein